MPTSTGKRKMKRLIYFQKRGKQRIKSILLHFNWCYLIWNIKINVKWKIDKTSRRKWLQLAMI